MPDVAALKAAARREVEEHRYDLVELSRHIHSHPETCFEEHTSSATVAAALARAGMQVERGVCELPTALRAEAGTGSITVAFCAEYDALPGLGHACGHNVIAATAVGAAQALAPLVTGQELDLRVVVLGTPAEEGGGGKILLLQRGAFDGVHAALMVHPWPEDRLSPVCLAVDHLEVEYRGRAAHASAAPAEGVNAADALTIAQVAIGLLRQHLRPGDQVHGVVIHGGDAPNIVPDRAAGRFMLRAPTLDDLAILRPRVQACFESGALATGTSLDVRDLGPAYSQFETDRALLAAWRSNAESVGRTYEADDTGAAQPVFSTDMANVSLALPAIHPLIGIDSAGAGIHQPGFARAATGASAEAAILDAATALAMTAIDAATDPELRDRLLRRSTAT